MTPAEIFFQINGTDWVATASNHHVGAFGPDRGRTIEPY